MNVTLAMGLRVFVSAAIVAAVLNLYVVQQLRRTGLVEESVFQRNLSWIESSRVLQAIVGRGTVAHMKLRTLFFPTFELAWAGAVTLSLYAYGFTPSFVRVSVFLAFAFALIVISSCTDRARFIAPHVITLSGTAVGILASFFTSAPSSAAGSCAFCSAPALHGFAESMGGALVGFVSFGAVWFLGHRLLHKELLGFGVVPTLMMTGAFLGVRSLLPVVLVGSATGTVYGIIKMLLISRKRALSARDLEGNFIVFLMLGGTVYVFFSDLVWRLVSK